jgi:hypothetical protein
MDALWELSWRGYPAAGLALAGLVLAACGVWRQRGQLALSVTDARKGAAMARALRPVLTGLALAAAAAAWTWHWPVVLQLAVVIGTEELLETSAVIAALDDAERRGVLGAPPGRAGEASPAAS